MRRSFALAFFVAALAGCSGADDPAQSPFSVIAKNGRSSEIYLEWAGDARWVFRLEIRRSDRWEPVSFMAPQCLDACSPDNAAQDCTLACKPAPTRVKVLGPGESLTFDWPGAVYTVNSTHCSAGDCYLSGRAERGHHRVRACWYHSADCATDPCPAPDADGIIDGTISGTADCSDAEFKIPYGEPQLWIDIE